MKIIPFLFSIVLSSFLFSCDNPCAQFKAESYNEDELKIEYEAKEGLQTLYNYLGEPDYSKSEVESYRLLSGAADELTKSIIRLDKTKSGYTISYKIFSAMATADRDMNVNIVEEDRFDLSEEDWNTFIKLIYDKKFWTMPEMTGKTGYKGITYFIEGARPQAKTCDKRTEHMVTRWNPKPGHFYTICMHIEDLLRTYKSA